MTKFALLLTLISSVVACAPVPAPPVSRSTVQKTIPAVFHGTWVTRPAIFDSHYRISATQVRGHESELEPSEVEVLEGGRAVRITGMAFGEGESWEESHVFRISPDGKELTHGSEGGAGLVYYRGTLPY